MKQKPSKYAYCHMHNILHIINCKHFYIKILLQYVLIVWVFSQWIRVVTHMHEVKLCSTLMYCQLLCYWCHWL